MQSSPYTFFVILAAENYQFDFILVLGCRRCRELASEAVIWPWLLSESQQKIAPMMATSTSVSNYFNSADLIRQMSSFFL